MAKNNFSKRKNKSSKYSSKLMLLVICLCLLFVIFCLFLSFYKNNFFNRNYAINNYIKNLINDDGSVYSKNPVIKKLPAIKNSKNSVINYEQRDKEYLDKIINKN